MTRELREHGRRQTLAVIIVAVVMIVSGLVVLSALHNDLWAGWLLGFGSGYIVCRAIHVIVEQRFRARSITIR